MGDCESLVSISEGEKHVFVACHHIVRALRAYNNVNTELGKILADLDRHLSEMTLETKTEETQFIEIEERLKDAENEILSWESNQLMLLDVGPSALARYLQAVYEIQLILGGFKVCPVNAHLKRKEIYNRATNVLDIAMSRLEKELHHIIDKHKEDNIQPNHMELSSRGEDIVYDESFTSLKVESVNGDNEVSHRDSNGHGHDEHLVDLVHPSVIPHIKSIADAMFACGYGQEFCYAFISIRRDALNEYVTSLEIERFSIEDVLKMEWEDLSREIKKWTWALKIVIRVYLASEKRLCEQIFGDLESVCPFCFIESSRPLILLLLGFGEAVAMGSHRPEKLIRLLNMCEVSADILLDVDHLLSEEAGSSLRIEFHKLSKKLSDSATATFVKFKNFIASHESSCPFPGGGIHPLTKYVMNYFSLLPSYSGTLNALLKDQQVNDPVGVFEPENSGQDISPCTFSPMASHLRSIVSVLEANLHNKARLYQNEPLQHIFVINNLHYMVQKVKCSELRLFFGDEWIRKHIGKFQHHARNYERATWSSMLSLLRDDSDCVSVTTLRDKCKMFSLAFEDVYRNQTCWFVPNPELRDDLRISTSVKVIQSYRAFLGRNGARIGERYIRYTCEDLQNLLLDLFEASPKSLGSSRRR